MYTRKNFRTKKEFKAAVDAFVAGTGPAVTYFQYGPFGGNEPTDGQIFFEGPHYPEAHKWYAQATAKDGVIVSVK